ncbi:MAG: RCC1 repeat-containing protein [Nitrospirota bacterium]|nr:RCC1 repeat-containing protein [Nitrospirota bacterium]
MRKRWFNLFMGMFVLLFACLWIAGCTEEIGSMGMKHKHDHDSADETEIVAIAGGSSHSLELKSDGTVWAWGGNQYGQLGDGTTIDSPAPIQVSGLTDVTAIAAGYLHSVALKTDGTVWTWGSNEKGQLGVTTSETCFSYLPCSTTPIQVSGLTDVIAIAAGWSSTIVLKTDGTMWEINGIDQLEPVLTDVTAISAGDRRTNALTTDGTVWTWGGIYTNSPQLASITDVAAIAAGYSHTLALKTDGTVWAWGRNNFGELGDGTTDDSYTPVQVSDLTDVDAIASGWGFSLALKPDGTVWAWGANGAGMLGVTTTEVCSSGGDRSYSSIYCSTIPVQVSGLTAVAAIAAGYSHTLALKTDGTVWAWGSNSNNQLGAVASDTCGAQDDISCSFTPIPVREGKVTGTYSVGGSVSGLTDTLVLQNNDGDDLTITANGPFTFATELTDLDIYDITVLTQPFDQKCSVASGRINAADVTDIQIKCVDILKDVVAIAAGGRHSIALKTDGTVWAWGSNRVGQLGDGTTTSSTSPVEVTGIENIAVIAAGGSHSIALKTDGTVWAWGYNKYGQLGDGTTIDSPVPIQISALTDVVDIATGGIGASNTFALKDDGTLWAWGGNLYGQLGNGTTTYITTTPVQVSGLTDIVDISVGGSHVVALKKDGTVWAWGNNRDGQLGLTTTETCTYSTPCSTTPIEVIGITDVAAIFAGRGTTFALKTDGTLWRWGWGNNTPVEMTDLTDVTAISQGGRSALYIVVLKTDSTVWVWGSNVFGQLGNGTSSISSSIPVEVRDLADITAISAGYGHTLALNIDGTVWAWGKNDFGQLGVETTEKCHKTYDCSAIPAQVLVTP